MKKAKAVQRRATVNTSISVDKDAMFWVRNQAAERHLNISRFINMLIYAAMFNNPLDVPGKVK